MSTQRAVAGSSSTTPVGERRTLDPRITFGVWVVLVAATFASFTLANHALGADSRTCRTIVIIVLAATKMMLIGAVFMELLTSKKSLFYAFMAYFLLVAAILIGIYT